MEPTTRPEDEVGWEADRPERPLVSPCRPISEDSPAAITIYPNARATRGGEVVEVAGIDDLWRLAKKADRPIDKTDARYYARAHVDGRRVKKNLEPPLLVILDVDADRVEMPEAIRRLELFGVAAVAHTTWSHGKKPGNCYRVLTDQVADSWDGLEAATRELFEIVGAEPTRESWKSPGFFVPATPKARGREFRAARTELDESEWEPRLFKPVDREKRRRVGRATEDAPPAEDVALVEDALPWIENHERDIWVTVGMALHVSGIENARELWDEWSASQDYPDFSPEEQDRVWDSFHDDADDGVGIGTILHMARRAGWRRPREKATPLEDFGDFLSPRERLLRDMNEKYAYVAVGRGVVADLSDPLRPIDLMSRDAFVGLHNYPKIPTGGFNKKTGEIETASIGQVWLGKWPRRRTYRRVDFMPEGGPETLPESTLNLWRGRPPLPEGPGSAQPWLDHCLDVVCSGDEKLWGWLLAWMAHFVQRPWDKIGTAFVMRGTEGVGKGVVASALVRLAGSHGLHVT